VKVSEAPPSGWYPDPSGGVRLRYWDGTDWTDDFRARPTTAAAADIAAGVASGDLVTYGADLSRAGLQQLASRRSDADAIVSQVRQATREEIDRANQLAQQRIRDFRREVTPIVSSYSNRMFNLLRLIAILIFLAVIAWLVFQAAASQSLFDWLGDRIDDLTESG
jgi:Protein of unknown function (DUF2510)